MTYSQYWWSWLRLTRALVVFHLHCFFEWGHRMENYWMNVKLKNCRRWDWRPIATPYSTCWGSDCFRRTRTGWSSSSSISPSQTSVSSWSSSSSSSSFSLSSSSSSPSSHHPSYHCGPLCHPGHQDQLCPPPYFIKQKQDSIYYFWQSSSLAPPLP